MFVSKKRQNKNSCILEQHEKFTTIFAFVLQIYLNIGYNRNKSKCSLDKGDSEMPSNGRSGVTYDDFNNSQANRNRSRSSYPSNRRNQIEENRDRPTYNSSYDEDYEARRGTQERFGNRGQRPGDEPYRGQGRPAQRSDRYDYDDYDEYDRPPARTSNRPQNAGGGGNRGGRPTNTGGGNRGGRSGNTGSGNRGGSAPRGGSGGGGGTTRKKKGHPFLKFLGIVVILLAILGAGFFISQNMKSDAEWQKEYVGTWQVKAIGNAANPIMSIGTSVVLGNSADISSNMTLGVAEGIEKLDSQITTFGIHKEYNFTFDKGHCVMTALDGTGTMEGDLHFGFLVVKDAAGTITLYEKKSQMYKMNYEPSQPDSQALLDIASKAAAGAGEAGQYALEQLQNVDQAQLEQYLSQTDPQKLQEMLGQMDPQAMQEMIQGLSTDPTQLSPDQQAALQEIAPNATP